MGAAAPSGSRLNSYSIEQSMNKTTHLKSSVAIQLQRDGARAFVKSWLELLGRIAGKSADPAPA